MYEKIFIVLFISFILVFCSCQSYTEEICNEQKFQADNAVTHECNYYYYNGKKIELIIDSDLKILLFINLKFQYRKILKEVNFKKAFLQREVVDKQKHHHNTKKRVTQRNAFYNTDALHELPMYISKKTGKSIGISNLIHIKLKDSKDKKLLDELESSLHISIYSQNEYLPLRYTVLSRQFTWQ